MLMRGIDGVEESPLAGGNEPELGEEENNWNYRAGGESSHTTTETRRKEPVWAPRGSLGVGSEARGQFRSKAHTQKQTER